MKGDLHWLVHWAMACSAGTRDFCSDLAALVNPDFCSDLAAQVNIVQNVFSPLYTISMPLFLTAQQARQAAVLGRLSISGCL
jgi:hypothetical protein